MTWEDNYLAHFGIKGQKWGVRRYQNEDGTLTAEGRERYLKGLTPDQLKAYRSLNFSDRKVLDKKLAEGKSMDRAMKELAFQRTAVATVGIAAGLYLSPVTRPMMKAAGRSIFRMGAKLFRAAKNSNAAQRGSLWIKQMMKRRQMVKNGGITLKKSAYSVRDIPFGGYLG